jgi:RND superfamily putative drug exporter
MKGWASFVFRRRRFVLAAVGLFVILAGALGAGVGEKLITGGYIDQSSRSAQADRELEQRFGAGTPNLVLLATGPGSVDSPEAAAAGADLTARLRQQAGVSDVQSYWSTADPTLKAALRSEDGRQALVLGRVAGDEQQAKERIDTLHDRLAAPAGPLQVKVGGQAQVDNEVDTQSKTDLLRAEAISVPITLVIMLFVFGSGVAAFLPLVIAGVAVVGTQLILLLLTGVTDVSIFALNLTTGLGLGLAIDYSLLTVSRFREALERDPDVEKALQVTLSTAGKTILYSSLTVACSLAGLLAFNTFFLKSFAYAGIAVTALAGAAAVIALPAVLAMLGPNVNRLRIPGLNRAGAGERSVRRWTAWAQKMMHRPVLFATAALVVLIALALPALSIKFSLADDRALPAGAPASEVSQALRDNFATQATNNLNVVAYGASGANSADLRSYATRLSELPGVERVDSLSGSYAEGRQVAAPDETSQRFAARTGDGSYLSATVSPDPLSAQSRELVSDVRNLDAPFDVEVTGTAATLKDTLDGQAAGLPWALGVMALATIVLLALMTGSLVVPLKAIVMNVLTLSATFGVIVWVFQEGHLQWLVGDFQVTGYVVSTIPLMLLCIAFGLSMDYEMFLLSRIKEEYDRTGDNRLAVVTGIARTSRIITAAAILLAVVFLSFVTSGIVYLKLLGLGTGLAILIDATLIRSVLLPATMALLGRFNWWGPAFLKRWSTHVSHGSHESTEPEPIVPVEVPVRS